MATEELLIEKQLVSVSRLDSIDFSELKFGAVFSDHMLVVDYENSEWKTPTIQPYADIKMSPAASVFHYGQAIFEGLKAHKNANGDIFLFRADENLKRMNLSAERMCMPQIPESIFLDGIKELIRCDKRWIPDGEGQSLYIRPFLIADQAFLGVRPSQTYKFMVITSPTAGYYSGAVKVRVEEKYSRACEGGIGSAKAAANYAASLYPARMANDEGYHQLVWTDSKEHKYIEESGTMNIMFNINGTLVTPSTEKDSILRGITRKSVIQIAKDWGYQLEERAVSVEEVIEAIQSSQLKEAFGIGTAATIAPFSSIGYRGVDYPLTDFRKWEFATKVKSYLENYKRGEEFDKYGWLIKV